MNIVASIAPCLYPPGFRYRSEWAAVAPDDRFTALTFVADVNGPAVVHVTLEQATDKDGADCKPARGTPLPGLLLPQRFDGYIIHYAGIVNLAGEDLDKANGYCFARVALDVLHDSVVTGAFLLCYERCAETAALACSTVAAAVVE